MSANIFIVHLRRPSKSAAVDPRTDPFYEFGSFGCTGCHSRNLLHAKNFSKVNLARFAFSQGGHDGFRLVFLTPPVDLLLRGNRCEAKWQPAEMPFRYHSAPILVANNSFSQFPLLEGFVDGTSRTTIEGGFSSKFRSCVTPLQPDIATELIDVYETCRKTCDSSDIATEYWHALPYTNGTQMLSQRRTMYESTSLTYSRKKRRRRSRCSTSKKKAC